MRIKAVISDLGNVLLNFDNMLMCKAISKFSPYSAEKIYKLIFINEFDKKYHKGLETSREFYNKVKRKIKIETRGMHLSG